MTAQGKSPDEALYAPPQPDDNSPHNSNAQLSAPLAFQSNAPDGSQHSFGKQNSLLHQSSSYLKQATSTFMRWQSRRAFWSAADPSAAQPQGVRVGCANGRLAIGYWLKTVRDVASSHPSILIVPLLLGCACLTGGLCAVILTAQNAQQTAQGDAALVAWQAAGALEMLVDETALQPAAALAYVAKEQPEMGTLLEDLPRLIARIVLPTTSGAVRQLLLAPFGVVNASFAPPFEASTNANATATSTIPAMGPYFTVGSALWADPWVRANVLAAAKKKSPVVTTSVPGPSVQDDLLAIYHAIYVPGVAADETWSNTVPAAFESELCGDGVCYIAGTRSKLWGFAVAVVSLSALAGSPDSGLASLADANFHYRLTVVVPSGTKDLARSPTLPARQGSTAVPVRLSQDAPGAGPTGELTMSGPNGGHPSWEGPLIAVVVLVSLALALLLFLAMFNYWRHLIVLRAMLPEKVISVLGTGSHYYQHLDCVTVLYADVVRYTATNPNQGDQVPTLEVVKLLNDVHSIYKAIIKKYGLVRIRRSGESFLCVGGCPTPDDPVAVAVRVAACARDMVLATSRFRGSGGFRVQIRVGLHSGPIVAAVVGSKIPRFSLFGDVVDVAYYMEATSRTMAIHVSDETSRLLATAKDPLLQLKPRGRMDIIGQGSMETSWIKLEQLPDPAAQSDTPGAGEKAQGGPELGVARRKGAKQGKAGRGSGGGA